MPLEYERIKFVRVMIECILYDKFIMMVNSAADVGKVKLANFLMETQIAWNFNFTNRISFELHNRQL